MIFSKIKNKLSQIIKPSVLNNQTMCPFTVVLSHLALVQAYEVCYELAWKVLKDYLFLNGISAQLPREVIKEAFSANVIKDGQVWIDMLQDRNSTSHEYNMDKVNLIIERIATVYNNELAKFNDWVNGINA